MQGKAIDITLYYIINLEDSFGIHAFITLNKIKFQEIFKC